jgi:hypothetical protein
VLTSSPEIERLTIKPQETPIIAQAGEGEAPTRNEPAPESLKDVKITARLMFACSIVNSLLKRNVSPDAIAIYLHNVKFTRAESESAWRLCVYMKRR